MKVVKDTIIPPEVESIDPYEVKQELLRKVPTKVARKRAKQIVVKVEPGGQEVPEIGANTRTIPGHHHPARLRLRRVQGRGPGPDPGHPPHHPRPDRLRLFYSWLTRRNQTSPTGRRQN